MIYFCRPNRNEGKNGKWRAEKKKFEILKNKFGIKKSKAVHLPPQTKKWFEDTKVK